MSNPPTIEFAQVWTAAQWNDFFASLVYGTGGTLTGELNTAAPTTSSAGFNLAPGVSPTSPNNGDLWATSGGLYAQINGETIGPLIGGIGTPQLLGVLKGANFNITTDQSIALSFPTGATNFFITEIDVVNGSTSLTTAQGGFYTAASKGGTVIGTTTTVYSNCTGATTRQRITGATNEDTTTFPVSDSTLYLSLTTPQGSAATADVYIFGIPYA